MRDEEIACLQTLLISVFEGYSYENYVPVLIHVHINVQKSTPSCHVGFTIFNGSRIILTLCTLIITTLVLSIFFG